MPKIKSAKAPSKPTNTLREAKSFQGWADIIRPGNKVAIEYVPALLARLADQHGILPANVPEGILGQAALQAAGVDPKSITHRQLAEAHGLFRAGIAESLRRVDEHNARTIAATPALSCYEAADGQVRLARAAQEPEIARPKPPADKPRKNGLAILGLPVGYLLQAMGRAGFSVSAARAALDELGGRGVSDSTIRTNLKLGVAEETAALTGEQLAELEPFRDAKPEPREVVVRATAAERQEQRLELMSVPKVGAVDF